MKKCMMFLLALLLTMSLSACGEKSESMNDGQGEESVEGTDKTKELGWGGRVTFGSYEQDNNLDNGKEAIEWLVLDVQQDKALLLSKYVLDARNFHEGEKFAYWDTCTLRDWLNAEFLTEAFDEKQQKSILLTDNEMQSMEYYEIEISGGSQEKVFLLDVYEAETYFKIAWGETDHFYDNNIKAEATAYALSKGLEEMDGRVSWFLRSPGRFPGVMYSCVGTSGYIGTMTLSNEEDVKGIRPAIWVDLDAELEIIQSEAADKDVSIEDLFPADWEGRYVIEETEYGTGITVSCKMAYDSAADQDKNQSWLFSIYHMTDDLMTLPDYVELGSYDGYPVEATTPWDVPVFTTDEITAEYTDMIYDIGGILDEIEDRIAEIEHFRQVETYGFDFSLYNIPEGEIEAGVYQLDCGSWSEKSKVELMGEYNHTSYLSVAPNGTVYLTMGSNEPIKGTLLAAVDSDSLPEGEPECIIWFEEDNTVRAVYYEQLTMTIHGMESVELNVDDPTGLWGSMWTYTWVDGNYWTEESLRDDIG